ncbi:MAG TPA: cytochrome c oxidase subunit I [Pyrinomonadaceae bacterium]|jgi:cytochrome c oxidase subunit 1|nr:cytochrome c oxidase subunit I [Pyrinomonadaceae bacterium]
MKLEEQVVALKDEEEISEAQNDAGARDTEEAREEDLLEDKERRLLDKTWGDRPGFWGWLTSTNHKSIGKRFIITAFIFFTLGGILAVLMRIQLARPENTFLGPDIYNQIFTMHGSTMMFLFAIPVMEAFAIYLVPLMVGTRNIAFPRLAAFSYWIYVCGGITLYVFFFLNIGPDMGWFSYVPLAGPEFSPGKRVDIWSQLINFTEISALAASIEIITTVFKLRAPGMSLHRIPIFVWAMLIMSFMVMFAMPAVMTSSLFLTLDRLVATQFYNQAEGGDPLLWQHLFWFFGHPEVYIVFIPALGYVSSIIQTFSRRKIFGYTALVLSMIATGFIGFGLWVHHMFATGLPQLGLSFFTAASMMIAIPSGVQIFCWIATLWSGRPSFKTPLLFVIGFFFIFVAGGLSGVMQASVPLDLQVHDTFFVVAHFHYVLIGGAVFPLFGAFYYWFPKFTGRMLSEGLGKLNFWLMFIGFNITFFPMHQLGLQGMPRRVYTYLPEMGWNNLNFISTVGALILTLGVLTFVINVFSSRRRGALAGNNPWDADTLEWGVSSPPPSYNFFRIPVVQGREALWARTEDAPVVVGLRSDCPEVLITKTLDAEPDHKLSLPEPTIWPLPMALAATATFITSIFTPWALPGGMVLAGIALIGWGWPKKKDEECEPPGVDEMSDEEREREAARAQ